MSPTPVNPKDESRTVPPPLPHDARGEAILADLEQAAIRHGHSKAYHLTEDAAHLNSLETISHLVRKLGGSHKVEVLIGGPGAGTTVVVTSQTPVT